MTVMMMISLGRIPVYCDTCGHGIKEGDKVDLNYRAVVYKTANEELAIPIRHPAAFIYLRHTACPEKSS